MKTLYLSSLTLLPSIFSRTIRKTKASISVFNHILTLIFSQKGVGWHFGVGTVRSEYSWREIMYSLNYKH